MARHTLGRAARKKGAHTKEQMQKGINLHYQGYSLRKAAKAVNVAYPTLRRYVLKYKSDSNARLVPHYDVNKVFNEAQEASLIDYIIECAHKFYGLTSKECRRVAYQMAKLNNIKMPPSWHKEEMAGKEWIKCFRKRHPEISIKKPEACSLSRATSFNRANIKTFFDNLKAAMFRNSSFGNGSRVYNLDETSTTTVQRPQKVLALKGQATCKVTSGERGVFVTTCCIVNAVGQYLPPVMVFPRKNYKQHMLNGALPGTLGLAAPSGWMNSKLFVDVIQHFIKFTFASPENPALLILDNHESHLSIEALDLAKAAGVTILTLHPHTTAKMQPLDVGLLAPFKTFYNSAVDSWMMRNPGQTFTIYNIAECVAYAYMKAMTPVNITNAFRKCGIFPLDENIFTAEDFLPSEVTNRPAPMDSDDTVAEKSGRHCESPSILSTEIIHSEDVLMQSLFQDNQTQQIKLDNSQPSTSAFNKMESASNSLPPSSAPTGFISPQNFRPQLKAGPRKTKRTRRAGKSMIATDTPEKNALTELKQKKQIKITKSVKVDLFKQKLESDSSDDEDLVYSGSSSGGEDFEEDSDSEDILDDNFMPLSRKPKVGDYVIIVLVSKKTNVYYIAKILELLEEDEECDFFVSYLKLKSKWNQTFFEPLDQDMAGVNLKEIKYILPPPKIEGTTRRQATYKFPVNLSLLNLGY